jgi:hypothetical protein
VRRELNLPENLKNSPVLSRMPHSFEQYGVLFFLMEKSPEDLGYVLIEDSKNYYVNNCGQVARKFERGTFNPLKPGKHSTGYLQQHIMMNDGRRVTRTIHSLVAQAFIGPRPDPAMVINHKNGVKTDNRAENLEYITRSENTKHGIKLGVRKYSKKPPKGADHHKAVLTDNIVKIIYECQSLSWNQLAHTFQIGIETVRKIKKGQHWKHITRGGVQLLLFPAT